LGAHIEKFFFGYDGAIRNFVADTESTSGNDDKFYLKESSFFLGYHFTEKWRGWAAAIIDVQMDDSQNNDLSGNGTKFGMGYMINPLFSINLEYISNKFDEVKPTGGTSYILNQS